MYELGMIFAAGVVVMLRGPPGAWTGRKATFFQNKRFFVALGVYVIATSLVWAPWSNTSPQCFMRVNCDQQASWDQPLPGLDVLMAEDRDVGRVLGRCGEQGDMWFDEQGE